MNTQTSNRVLPTLTGTISGIIHGVDKNQKPFARLKLAYTSKAGASKTVTAMVFHSAIELVRSLLVEGANVRFSGLVQDGNYKVICLPNAA